MSTHTYKQWLQLADSHVQRLAGVSIHDLPDGNSHDAWSDEVPPSEYAEERLLDGGFPPEGFPESSSNYKPAPVPTHRFLTVPPTVYTENITLENGRVITVKRSGSANGKVIEVVAPGDRIWPWAPRPKH